MLASRSVSSAPRTLVQRLDHLRSPDSGTVGQGFRYAVAGGTVAVVYLTVTTVLADGFGVPFQIALATGFVTAICVHFTLQRFFVWVHHNEFALGFKSQVGRYLVVASVQYVITALATSLLPAALGVPVTPVYFVTAITLAVANFLIFRTGVFHASGGPAQ